MTGEKTNRDMQWICRTPQRMERCDEEGETRPRADGSAGEAAQACG
ncbi:hypothetical protein KH990_11965 [Methanoculleus bourgensis]|uniref:Uncharacterized protein n=1 Tax=Methanoculleus bourgensis TaxID=83986 RepID=A0A7K4C4F3_9EURY|nr:MULTISPECIES: hypothetical protein [Methanoculleus]MBT0734069.1 hypothetical protein [Methanoculleus bourgensis]MDD3372638.1 hypothetical protein [Methanoculleus bourgensis]NMA88885.1 hypothetical protein [Methanoculleus bourgensis]NQS79245.1 hypothetical protein [Methanoculleus bourgensis]SAI87555.1 hypothetical protein MBBA_0677 [Methanoculleus bourgensis]